MGDDLVFGGGCHPGETEQARVVVKIGEECGFANGLQRIATDSADTDERNGAVAVGPIHFFSGKC